MSATPPLAAPYSGLAPYYDLLVGDAAFDAIWRAFRSACAKYRVRFSSAADLGCGTGRFLVRLSRILPSDAPLYGVDRSPQMLAIARRRMPARRVQLLCQDMRDFSLPAPVELLTCNFDGLNYVRTRAGLASMFRACARNLVRGGHLFFDMLRASSVTDEPVLPFMQRIAVGDMRATWVGTLTPGDRSQVVITACRGRGSERRCWREVHHQRWWSLETVLRLLRRAGLAHLGVHSLPSFRRSQETDRWVQIVAQRC